MGFENYISEREAAELAGIVPSTLKRFAEAGYFRMETEADGLRLYSRTDLERVFGLKALSPASQGAPLRQVLDDVSIEEPVTGQSDEDIADLEDPSLVQESNASTVAAREEPALKQVPTEQNGRIAEITRPEELTDNAAATFIAKAQAALAPKVESDSHQHALEALESRNENRLTAAHLEHERKRHVIVVEMHEKLLALREDEIQSLKDEREWLRARIEKLEEKGQRDQLLLLSETQTIKTLISLQESRRSPVRLALEWLGLAVPRTEDPVVRRAIDVSPAATSMTAESAEKASGQEAPSEKSDEAPHRKAA